MTTGFQQQELGRNLNLSKAAPTPQHGKKADPEAMKRQAQPRSFEPRPGRS